MRQFIHAFLFYGIKTIFFMLIALLGLYIGYRIRHKREVYFKNQRKKIEREGKLIAYLNFNYKAVFKKKIFKKNKEYRNKEWLYNRCFDYASKFNMREINGAKAYLKRDLKVFELFGLMITIFVGLSSSLIYSYALSLTNIVYNKVSEFISAEKQQSFYDNLEKSLESLIGLLLMALLIFLIYRISYPIKKQEYLISVLEDVVGKKEKQT